jgi:hypothetical protein
MPRSRVYVDTSVIGGYFDPEFERWTKALVDDFRSERLEPVLSELLAAELEDAPDRVRDLYAELRGRGTPVPVTPEVVELTGRYGAHAILPARFRNDMTHIAIATIANADVVASWNFRHIVRFDKIRLFNAVNLEAGYKAIAVHSPREIASDDSETK